MCMCECVSRHDYYYIATYTFVRRSVCYDNVNSRASKILLAVDLWNFENNNNSSESVSLSSLSHASHMKQFQALALSHKEY